MLGVQVSCDRFDRKKTWNLYFDRVHMDRSSCLLLFLTIGITCVAAQTCGYKKCNSLPIKPGMINVHLVPHTHDDVGWLKTVDQYYYGANTTIQRAGVQYILDGVIPQLEANPRRRFIYVEMAFFKRWWDEQDEDMHGRVKKLVDEGRLEFINGGWCMNDEASTHYNAIIDQMTLGLQFLNTTFGDCGRPLVAWHIDPFGHSREQASIFAQMGYDGFFFARLDYQDKMNRLNLKNMEEIWRGSPNDLGKVADLFTGALFGPLYTPPPGLCFELLCQDPPVQDDPRLHDYNVEERVKTAENRSMEQAKHFRTEHIMWTMGSDFHYQAANIWFKNMDKLIKYTNAGNKVNLLYSTPSCYVYHKNQAADVKWSYNNTDDFFPYADKPHSFWSGYFTSRPAIKGYVRECNNFLQVCKQLEVIAGPLPFKNGGPSSQRFREAMAVAQHHDAVSGTEKQHVANDYAMRLHAGAVECQAVVGRALTSKMKKGSVDPPAAQFCTYLNISICPTTENNDNFAVTVYNPLARQLTGHYLRLPVNGQSYTVSSPTGTSVETQVLKVSPRTVKVRGPRGNATSELVFPVTVPALGFNTYLISQASRRNTRMESLFMPQAETNVVSMMIPQSPMMRGDTEIHNEHLSLVFDSTTGYLKTVTNLKKKLVLNVNQAFYWYNSSTGNNKDSTQRSGAYIFRPNGTEPLLIQTKGSVITKVVAGKLVQEVHQVFNDWVTQVIRLYAGQRHAELEWTVGPIPFKDGLGKEIITRFDSDLKTDKKFYTDANGREILQRELNHRQTWKLNQTEPVAGNYYPVNSRIFIKDASKQLTVLTDRSQGGSSLKDGSLELMVHRRMFYDDNFGVGEALNETGVFGDGLVARGKHYLMLESPADSGQLHRTLGEQLYMAPAVSFTPNTLSTQDWSNNFNMDYTALKRELPPSVHLLTLELSDGDTALLRLEHQYQAADRGTPQTVSLQGLFEPFEVVTSSVEELTLGGNIHTEKLHRLSWNTEEGTTGNVSQQCWDPSSATVSLKPMQICTLRFHVKRRW
ncbi:lysosomal alpha-mannosidase-like isoform X1 [Branchiostoma floridae x Branchiostoma belcheri]